MSKNFFAERRGWLEALDKQKTALAEHRESLEVFKFAFSKLDENSSNVLVDALQNAITRETAKVNSIENEIRGIKRILDEKYSLRPAS